LKELAEEVKKAWQRRISLKAFVGIILSYAGFYPEEVNQEIEQSIGDNSHVSMEEKRKIKADMLLSQKKYAMAGREYARLLASLPEDRQKLRGEIYQSCGICLARMFSYEQAGEYFLQAHRLTGKIACYKQYLWTKRLSMTEEEFIRFLKQHEEAYEDSLEIDRTLEELNRQWSRSNYALLLQSIREEKEKQDIPAYRRKLTERVEYLKDAYREMVSQTR
jgi:tetratricopeptide (TPR) repeat protein